MTTPTIDRLRIAVIDRELRRCDDDILDYLTAQPGSPQRLAAGGRIADLLTAVADRLDQSPGLREIGFLADPEAIRAEAALWRAGQHEGSGASLLRCNNYGGGVSG